MTQAARREGDNTDGDERESAKRNLPRRRRPVPMRASLSRLGAAVDGAVR